MKDRFGMDVNISNYLIPGDDGAISALVTLMIWLFLFLLTYLLLNHYKSKTQKERGGGD